MKNSATKLNNGGKKTSQLVFWLGIFIFACLTFLVTYTLAYFTATARLDGTLKFAEINVVFDNSSSIMATENSVQVSTSKILPGQSVTASGKINNTGECSVYCLLEMDIDVKNLHIVKYYQLSGSELSMVNGEYVDACQTLSVGASVTFNIAYELDGEDFGNEYKNEEVSVEVIAHAIQQPHVDSVRATNILISGMPVVTVYIDGTPNVLDKDVSTLQEVIAELGLNSADYSGWFLDAALTKPANLTKQINQSTNFYAQSN